MAGKYLHPYESAVLFVVILGGIATLVFGLRDVRGLIFKTGGPLPPTAEAQRLSGQADSEAALRAKDTDGDGLSDYDELNLWNTSPYIPDSDSDGYDDKTEVESGNDPNCPRGKDCGRGVEVPAASPDEVIEATGSPEDIFPRPVTEQLFGSGQERNFSALSGSPGPEDIRALLKQYGIADEILDQISDEELVELYKEALGQAEQAADTETGSGE